MQQHSRQTNLMDIMLHTQPSTAQSAVVTTHHLLVLSHQLCTPLMHMPVPDACLQYLTKRTKAIQQSLSRYLQEYRL